MKHILITTAVLAGGVVPLFASLQNRDEPVPTASKVRPAPELIQEHSFSVGDSASWIADDDIHIPMDWSTGDSASWCMGDSASWSAPQDSDDQIEERKAERKKIISALRSSRRPASWGRNGLDLPESAAFQDDFDDFADLDRAFSDVYRESNQADGADFGSSDFEDVFFGEDDSDELESLFGSMLHESKDDIDAFFGELLDGEDGPDMADFYNASDDFGKLFRAGAQDDQDDKRQARVEKRQERARDRAGRMQERAGDRASEAGERAQRKSDRAKDKAHAKDKADRPDKLDGKERGKAKADKEKAKERAQERSDKAKAKQKDRAKTKADKTKDRKSKQPKAKRRDDSTQPSADMNDDAIAATLRNLLEELRLLRDDVLTLQRELRRTPRQAPR